MVKSKLTVWSFILMLIAIFPIIPFLLNVIFSLFIKNMTLNRILDLLTFMPLIFITPFAALISLILSIISWRLNKKNNLEGTKMTKWALIISIVIILCILFIIVNFSFSGKIWG